MKEEAEQRTLKNKTSKQRQIVYMYTPPIPSTTCMLPPPIPSTMLPPPISSTMPYSAYGMPSDSLSGVPSAPHPSHLV